MREVADRERISAFMAALARHAPTDTDVFLVGGTTAVLVGWRATTIDIDMVMRPESDAMLRAIPLLKEQLHVNVELASPDMFIPVPRGWEQRSPLIARMGRVNFRHFEFVAQALSKLERGHARDLADVQAMLARDLISATAVREQFAQIEPELFRFPSIDPATFRRSVDEAFPPRQSD